MISVRHDRSHPNYRTFFFSFFSLKGMVGSDVYICYKKSMNRADLISYRPSLLSRFPLKNNPAYSLEETVALFCLPMGANLECWPANSAR